MVDSRTIKSTYLYVRQSIQSGRAEGEYGYPGVYDGFSKILYRTLAETWKQTRQKIEGTTCTLGGCVRVYRHLVWP